jgi:cytochrome c oxidase assembly factor CtaG
LFWQPVITTPATWLVPLYLFLAALPCDTLGAFLVFCDHVVYPQYRHAHGTFYLSPLQDQALAGATMWVAATFAYMMAALVTTTRLVEGPNQGQMRDGFGCGFGSKALAVSRWGRLVRERERVAARVPRPTS